MKSCKCLSLVFVRLGNAWLSMEAVKGEKSQEMCQCLLRPVIVISTIYVDGVDLTNQHHSFPIIAMDDQSRPTSPREYSTNLVRDLCWGLSTVAFMVAMAFNSDDLAAAFATARNCVDQISRPPLQLQRYAINIRMKWCYTGNGDVFQGLANQPAGLVRVLLLDIWRDLLMLKYGPDGFNILYGLIVNGTVPDVNILEGSVDPDRGAGDVGNGRGEGAGRAVVNGDTDLMNGAPHDDGAER